MLRCGETLSAAENWTDAGGVETREETATAAADDVILAGLSRADFLRLCQLGEINRWRSSAALLCSTQRLPAILAWYCGDDWRSSVVHVDDPRWLPIHVSCGESQ